MSTTPVTSATDTAAPTASATNRLETVGKDAFLRLLVTQLQNQNPLDPQDNSEFLAQLAQFSALESLQNIQSDIAALRAAIGGAADPQSPASNGGA